MLQQIKLQRTRSRRTCQASNEARPKRSTARLSARFSASSHSQKPQWSPASAGRWGMLRQPFADAGLIYVILSWLRAATGSFIPVRVSRWFGVPVGGAHPEIPRAPQSQAAAVIASSSSYYFFAVAAIGSALVSRTGWLNGPC